jgi:hypothetical protein
VLAPAEPAAGDVGVAAAEASVGTPVPWAEDAACPPVAWGVAVPQPAAISAAAARPKSRVRMPFRRCNRACGCVPLSPPGTTQAMIKDNSNKRSRSRLTL